MFEILNMRGARRQRVVRVDCGQERPDTEGGEPARCSAPEEQIGGQGGIREGPAKWSWR